VGVGDQGLVCWELQIDKTLDMALANMTLALDACGIIYELLTFFQAHN
jgi:hypothetical protein